MEGRQQRKKALPKRAARRNELSGKRERQHVRGAKRKAERIAAQKAREQTNRERRAQGLPTPWERARIERRMRRAATKVGGQS
jgi:hypothetical protein